MDWCSVYLTPQGLPKYIYLSPLLIVPTTYNGIRTKTRPVWITLGAAPLRWMGLIRNPRWEQKRTEGYVIVSKATSVCHLNIFKKLLCSWQSNNNLIYCRRSYHFQERCTGRQKSKHFYTTVKPFLSKKSTGSQQKMIRLWTTLKIYVIPLTPFL